MLIEVVVPLEAAPPLKSVSATNVPTAELPQAIWMPVPAARVVVETDELCAPVPAESVAATVNEYVVDADSPVTVNDVLVDVPMDVPPLKMV